MNLKKADFYRWLECLSNLREPLLLILMLWGCVFALMLLSSAARAELRCNCAAVIDTCSATVNLDTTRVGIASDTQACARVDYLIDGQPFTALVVGGSTELDWTGQPLHSPNVIVESCRVCADAGTAVVEPAVAVERAATTASAGTAPATASAPAAEDHEAKPMIKVMADYPRDAWINRIEGEVVLEYRISASGKVEDIRVITSTNPVFVRDSMAALSRFRFTPASKAGQPVAVPGKRERFRFRIPDGVNPTVSSNEA